MKIRETALLALGIALLAAPPAAAQGTRADYERARGLRRLVEGKFFRDRIRPRWLPGDAGLWYRVETGPGSHEFVFVDVEKGARRPAFDHARLAGALGRAGVEGARAENLPIDGLDFEEGGAFAFRAGGKRWRCDPASYELREAADGEGSGPSARRLDGPRPSRRTGPDTSLTFANRTAGDVEIFWIDAEGERRSYGKIRAGESREQHTFAGHVWLVVDAKGEPVLAVEADEEPARVEVDGRDERGERPRARREGRRRKEPGAVGVPSPDGRLRAFVREHDVWVKDAAGEEARLSADGSPEAAYTEDRIWWSPDSVKIAALRFHKVEERQVHVVESSPKDQVEPKLRSFGYAKPGDPLPLDEPRLFHVAERRAVPVKNELFPNPWSISEVRWSPGSGSFTFLYNARGHQALRVIEVDAATGAARAIVDERSPTFIDYAGKFHLEFLDRSREIVWMSERDGWNHLWLYDAAAGRPVAPITRGEWVVRNVLRLDEKERRVWFRAGGIRPGQDPYQVHWCRANLDGTGLVVLTKGDGDHRIEFSPTRKYLIDVWSRVDLPPVTELRRAEDGSLVCELERADASALLATGWRPPERFVAKGRDGTTDIYGVIYRPTNFDAGRKYPVLEDIYAGPQGSFVPKSFRTLHGGQEMAELGFIVVQIDGMGTSNRSKKFHDVCWKNLADSGFPDRILWMKAAAETRPWMDLTRVGVYGGSAGGQSAARALMDHGDFYKAAVADCGCHDNRMDKVWWNELWMGWPVGPEYAENSNVVAARRLQGKLLLIVGELDRNVDPASTMQVVDALIKADKDFDLLVVPGAGHGAAGTPYGHRRLQDHFVRHLLGVDPRSK